MATPSLPPAERDVLACLHRHQRATARLIRETLSDFRPMAHGSVVTLLRRLEAKGLVTRSKGEGSAFVYRAKQQPRVTFQGEIRRMVERLFHGDGVALVATLFETNPPNAEEVERLQRMLDEYPKRK